MKKRIFAILAVTGMFIMSCRKDQTSPDSTGVSKADSTSTKTTTTVTPPTQPTAPTDTTKGYIQVQLADAAVATGTDNILIEFNPASSAAYVVNQDARTFVGQGLVSLSSLSSDGVALAINSQPLWTNGTTIPLVVNAKNTGLYDLQLTAMNDIPANIDIWLKDKKMKDSLDIKLYPSYAFNIATTDTTTYGSSRFSIVLRAH